MPSVTIEQRPESRQTYMRISGVGRLLKKPEFRIAADSNEMLGPFGWKNQAIVNRTRQVLQGSDLILEVDPRLVSYIETGRAIEIVIEELGLSERILPPPLMAFPASNAPKHPDAIAYDAPPPAPPPLPPTPGTDEETQPVGGFRGNLQTPKVDLDILSQVIDEAGRTTLVNQTTEGDGHTTLVDPATEEDGSGGPGRETEGDGGAEGREGAPPEVIDDPGEERAKETSDELAIEPPVRGHNWKALAAAVVFGLILGFFAKYFADEYGPWPNGDAPSGGNNRKLALVQADAFAPLSEDLKQMPDKSPAGVAPDALPGIGPFSGNRGPIYFNQGVRKAHEGNKREAAYWYKRALLVVDPNVLAALGGAYMSGEGVPRDVRTGYQILRLAAGLGSETARGYIAEQLEHGAIPNAPPALARAFHSN
jgi:hypothetical protein